jgi:hypothetical protein
MAATNPMPNSAAVNAANDIRDIKPPIEITSAWAWVWWALGAIAVAAIAYAAWKYWRKQQSRPRLEPVIPAHVRAKQKLQEALALLNQPKPFCTLVSNTIRFYLEERFEFHAPERTTEEFLYELQSTNLLLPDQKESLGEFLKRCDLVKFAKYEPREAELRDLHDSALRLVEETEPQQAEPATGSEDASLVTPHASR